MGLSDEGQNLKLFGDALRNLDAAKKVKFKIELKKGGGTVKQQIGLAIMLVLVAFTFPVTPVGATQQQTEPLLTNPLTTGEVIPVEGRAVEPGIVPRVLPWVVSSLLLSAFVTFLLLRRKPKR